ncbi:MAG: hypothetical protein ACP5VC_02785, partial [Bryobacteraceae bacterium]
WDPRPGQYFLEWWEGPQRRRQSAGQTPAEALEAVRRKQLELAGLAVLGGGPDAARAASSRRRRVSVVPERPSDAGREATPHKGGITAATLTKWLGASWQTAKRGSRSGRRIWSTSRADG